MTIKEFANEVTAEFEESKMIPAPLVEDNLLLVLDNFDSLNEYIEQDVLSALLHRMDKLTGDYKEIIDLFFEKQRRNLAEIEPVQETVTSENGKLHTVQAPNVKMTTIDNVEEKEPDWLITNYIPRYQITSLAGDGGSGKTTVCSGGSDQQREQLFLDGSYGSGRFRSGKTGIGHVLFGGGFRGIYLAAQTSEERSKPAEHSFY